VSPRWEAFAMARHFVYTVNNVQEVFHQNSMFVGSLTMVIGSGQYKVPGHFLSLYIKNYFHIRCPTLLERFQIRKKFELKNLKGMNHFKE
jgi:hypothetical protein